MFDQSLSKSKDLGDMLMLLPGVVVQKKITIQGMADFLKFDVLAMASPNTFSITSMTIYVMPPQIFFLD